MALTNACYKHTQMSLGGKRSVCVDMRERGLAISKLMCLLQMCVCVRLACTLAFSYVAHAVDAFAP